MHGLRDVSFEVGAGEFFGIVGRNGSGKSTLLKCLAGIYAHRRGRDLRQRAPVDVHRARRRLQPRPRGARQRDDQRRDARPLARARRARASTASSTSPSCDDFTELKLKNYSSGMLVRLAFSVMIQVDADILLIDEVLAVGDAAFQQKCFDEFGRIRDEGTTVVLVTHDMCAVAASATARCCSSTARSRSASPTSRQALPRPELRPATHAAAMLGASRARQRVGDGTRRDRRGVVRGRAAASAATTLLQRQPRARSRARVRFRERGRGPALRRRARERPSARPCSRP